MRLFRRQARSEVRVATWNLKQAVGPLHKPDVLWQWMADNVDPHVVAFTEGKVPGDEAPDGWTALWQPGGIGPKRRWGTVLAARNAELDPISSVGSGRHRFDLDSLWPGYLQIADVYIDGSYWATVVALHSPLLLPDGTSVKHAMDSTPLYFKSLRPLFLDPKRRVIFLGDFNMHPAHLALLLPRSYELVELSTHTALQRSPLPGCTVCDDPARCGHIWTHKNGKSPNAARQQIDFILVHRSMLRSLVGYEGGPDRFPDIWTLSDHAPLVATFER